MVFNMTCSECLFTQDPNPGTSNSLPTSCTQLSTAHSAAHTPYYCTIMAAALPHADPGHKEGTVQC